MVLRFVVCVPAMAGHADEVLEHGFCRLYGDGEDFGDVDGVACGFVHGEEA